MLANGPSEQWPMLTEAFQNPMTPANGKIFEDALAYTRSANIPRANEAEIFGAMDPILDDLWLCKKTAAEVAPLIKAAVDPLLNK